MSPFSCNTGTATFEGTESRGRRDVSMPEYAFSIYLYCSSFSLLCPCGLPMPLVPLIPPSRSCVVVLTLTYTRKLSARTTTSFECLEFWPLRTPTAHPTGRRGAAASRAPSARLGRRTRCGHGLEPPAEYRVSWAKDKNQQQQQRQKSTPASFLSTRSRHSCRLVPLSRVSG